MYVYLAAALAIAAASFAGGWQVNGWRHDSIEKDRIEQAREDKAIREKTIDHAAEGHEKDKAKLHTEFAKIDKEVEHVLQTDFYAASAPACLDDDGLRQLNAAIGPASPASQPASAVHGPEPRHWWQPRRDAPVVD